MFGWWTERVLQKAESGGQGHAEIGAGQIERGTRRNLTEVEKTRVCQRGNTLLRWSTLERRLLILMATGSLLTGHTYMQRAAGGLFQHHLGQTLVKTRYHWCPTHFKCKCTWWCGAAGTWGTYLYTCEGTGDVEAFTGNLEKPQWELSPRTRWNVPDDSNRRAQVAK